jgi:hypothetical protein
LRKREQVRVLSSTQRYGVDFEEIVIAIDPKTGIVTSRGPLAEAEIQNALESTCVLLAEQREWMTANQIATTTKTQRKTVYEALRSGLDDRILERAGSGKKKPIHTCGNWPGSPLPTRITRGGKIACSRAIRFSQFSGFPRFQDRKNILIFL